MENKKQQVELTVQDEMMEEVVEADVQKHLSSLRPTMSKCCIYTVPECIRKGKESCFQPFIVSIGPIFYKNPQLEAIQELKWIYMESFLQHPNNVVRSLDPYIKVVRELEGDIRDCYQEKRMKSCADSPDEFIKMILLDAIFLIVILIEEYCPIIRPIPKEIDILRLLMNRDLLLEENQIPFFVLKHIFELAFPTDEHLFIELTHRFIGRFATFVPGAAYAGNMKLNDLSSISHFLDLCRKWCCYSLSMPELKLKPAQLPETASLHAAAGIKFRKSESLNPLGITFNKKTGELHIPQFTVDENTEAVLRNFLHFEQCHYIIRDHCYFIDLFFFLDSLIDSAEDIQILQQNKILKSYLGSDEKTAILFNITTNIFTKAHFNQFYDVSKELNEYANKPWNKWIAILRRDYFKHPWAILSFIFAITLFILTVLQTVTSFTSD